MIGNTDRETTNNTGGVRFTLSLNQSHSFFFKMGCGPNTNTRDELLALLDLLVSIASMGPPSLFVWGDSFVIINWTNSKESLSTLNLYYLVSS